MAAAATKLPVRLVRTVSQVLLDAAVITVIQPPVLEPEGTFVMLTHSPTQFIKLAQKALADKKWELIIAEYSPTSKNDAPYNQAIVNEIQHLFFEFGVDLKNATVLMVEANLGHAGDANPIIDFLRHLIDDVLRPSDGRPVSPTQVLLFSGTDFHAEDFTRTMAALSADPRYVEYVSHISYQHKESNLVRSIKALVEESLAQATHAGAAPAAATAFAPPRRGVDVVTLTSTLGCWWCC